MSYRNLLLVLFLSFAIMSCSKEDDSNGSPNNANNNSNNNNNNNTQQGGPYKIEATGAQNFTLEGKAGITNSSNNTDTSVTVILASSKNDSLGGFLSFVIPSGVYQPQKLQIDAGVPPQLPYASFSYFIEAGSNAPMFGSSGSVEITEAKKDEFIKGTLQIEGVTRPENDTVLLSGNFEARMVQ